jgi:two-component system NarL family response regulator
MTFSQPINVLSIDDHLLIRKGLKDLLSVDPNIHVVGDFGEVDEALNSEADIHPDVILLDLNLNGVDGRQACPALRKKYKCKVIALTQYELNQINIDKFDFDGFVNKTDNEHLVGAIKEVVRGGKHFPKDEMVQSGEGQFQKVDQFLRATRITERELEVIKLVVRGLTNKEISAELYIAEDTVKTHRKNFYQKSGARKIPDLMSFLTANHIAY